MSINFFLESCQDHSKQKRFGLCDDQSEERAYLDEQNGAKWIAVVENEYLYNVTFTAVDHCIEIKRADGKMAKRCDGLLTYNATIIFVELKERGASGIDWVKDGENQLRTTIAYYETAESSLAYKIKRAYIANKERPYFKQTQIRRMDQFLDDTGYILRIENRIKLEH